MVYTVSYLSWIYFTNIIIMLTVCSHVLNILQILFFQPLQVKYTNYPHFGGEKPEAASRFGSAELEMGPT